jgi:hypothetical protein
MITIFTLQSPRQTLLSYPFRCSSLSLGVLTSNGMGCRNFEAVRKNAFSFYAINFACYSDGKPYEPPDSFHYFGADPDFDRLLSVARYRHCLRPPRAFLEFLARGLFAPHFAAIVCSFTQAHTAFLSSSVSFASGCITAYVRGGILPVDTSPQTPWQDRARRESTVLRTHHRSRQGVKRFAVGVLHFENVNVDPKFLSQQLQALLAKHDAKQLQKAYRVLLATPRPHY